MPRKKSPVVLPQPDTPVLRRSARLISRQNRDGQLEPAKDLSFGRKIRREIGPEASPKSSIEGFSSKKFSESNDSMDGFPSVRRSLRVLNRGFSDAGKEKFPRCCSKTNISCSFTPRRSARISSGGGSVYRLQSSSIGRKSGNSVLGRCSMKLVSSEKGKCGGDSVQSRDRSRSRPKTKQMFRDSDEKEEEEEVGVCVSKGKGNGVRYRDRSRSRPRPKTKQMSRDSDDDEEEEVSLCLSEGKRMRIAKKNEEENAASKAGEGKRIEKEEEGLKTKNDRGWTEELELALQGAYLTVKPSPNFWKKVSKMVPGKSAQECFDRVNADLITPRQHQPRSRARKSNLSPIPQFSLSASKLLKINSPKTKIRQRKGNLSKKAIRHLLEKQNHMDQDLGFDLFSVLEPGATSNFLSTPTEKGKSLPRILESQMPGSSKDQTNLVSPPVLKQVKNKALHEKYIDHLHVREAKRKAEYNRLVGKENVRPIDNQRNDSVRAAKDALFFNVQDAVQKLKNLETENSSGSSEFCYGRGETDEEDESI